MSDIYFTKEHEWVKIKDGVASIGISEHAAHALGDITFVELPQVGKKVKQFGGLCSIESVKAASDIYAPLSGTVTKVNEILEEQPEIVNEAPEDAGWMALMTPDDLGELKNLMTREQYQEFLRGLE
jgi:glycine cleavage system H protein